MIAIKNSKEIEILKQGGGILASILAEIAAAVTPGITTGSLNTMARALIHKAGGKPAFLGYMGFPAALCTSVNDVIVHGVPSRYLLQEGDIIGLDIGLTYRGLITDMAMTLAVGKISAEAEELISVTRNALALALKETKPGKHLGDVGFAIQNFSEARGYQVIKELIGHGVGYKVHEDPEIPNFGEPGQGPELKEGMVLAIEPMVSTGDWRVRQLKDGSFATRDGSLAAHFEQTLAVTKIGAEVLTPFLS